MSTPDLPSEDVTSSTPPLERSRRSLPAGTAPAIAGGGLVGAATGAALGAGFGPIGLTVGAIAGAVTGGLGGKGLAESTTPTDEGQYWREEHARQPYAAGRPFDDYIDAYAVGYQGFARYRPRLTFDQHEPELRRDYEQKRLANGLTWDEARPAARAAWERLARNEEGLIDCTVLDQAGNSVGRIHTLWRAPNGMPTFAGITTFWLLGKVHVVPLHNCNYDAEKRTLRLPYPAELVRKSPSVDSAGALGAQEQERACALFDLTVPSVLAENMIAGNTTPHPTSS